MAVVRRVRSLGPLALCVVAFACDRGSATTSAVGSSGTGTAAAARSGGASPVTPTGSVAPLVPTVPADEVSACTVDDDCAMTFLQDGHCCPRLCRPAAAYSRTFVERLEAHTAAHCGRPRCAEARCAPGTVPHARCRAGRCALEFEPRTP